MIARNCCLQFFFPSSWVLLNHQQNVFFPLCSSTSTSSIPFSSLLSVRREVRDEVRDQVRGEVPHHLREGVPRGRLRIPQGLQVHREAEEELRAGASAGEDEDEEGITLFFSPCKKKKLTLETHKWGDTAGKIPNKKNGEISAPNWPKLS